MLQFLANGCCKGAVIALVALGFGLIYTTTRVFHIAHAAIFVICAYALAWALAKLSLPLPLAISFGLCAAISAGILVEWLVYRPLAEKQASSAVVLISSLGVMIVVVNAIALAFGNQTQILRAGVEKTAEIGPIILTYVQIAQAIAGLLLTTGLWLFLKYTRSGQLFRAVSDNEALAAVLGVKVLHVRLLVFALGSAFAGAGAVLVALDVGVDPNSGFPAVLAAAVGCIIGGLRNFLAPALGGLVLGVIQSLVVWQTSAKWETAVTFGLLIVFLLFRKEGMFGDTRRVEEA